MLYEGHESSSFFLCVLSVLCVLYCGIMGVLWWLASFVSCTVAISMLLVFMVCASSMSFFVDPVYVDLDYFEVLFALLC